MRTSFGALGAVAVLGLVFACGDGNDGTSDGKNDAGTSTPDGGAPGTPPDGSDLQPNPDGGVSPSFVAFDINHVIFTGQSNETGNDARPALSLTQPYTNLAFDTGPMSMTGGYSYSGSGRRLAPIAGCDDFGCRTAEALTAFKPLVEGDAYFDNSYAGGAPPYAVETPASGLANQISRIATTGYGLERHDVLASVDGRSGNGYACIRKGGAGCTDHYGNNYGSVRGDSGYLSSFKQSMDEVTAAKALAAAANKSYVVRGIAAVHGEQDSDDYFYGSSIYSPPLVGSDGTPGALASYTDALLEWQRDFEGGVKAITAQTQAVPMFVVQISNWGETIRDGDRTASRVPQMQLDAHVKAPGKVVLVGAGYPLEIDQGDCLHYTSEGTRRLGEYFGKVYTEVVIAGRTWEPVRPKRITRSGTTITVQYFVPRPPLAIDTTQVAEAPGKGFTVVDASGNAVATVTDAKVTAPDTVTLTLNGEPAAGAHLRYALNHDTANGCAGPQNGPRGNVRDSDTTPSQSGGAPLQNWGVHFDLPIP